MDKEFRICDKTEYEKVVKPETKPEKGEIRMGWPSASPRACARCTASRSCTPCRATPSSPGCRTTSASACRSATASTSGTNRPATCAGCAPSTRLKATSTASSRHFTRRWRRRRAELSPRPGRAPAQQQVHLAAQAVGERRVEKGRGQRAGRRGEPQPLRARRVPRQAHGGEHQPHALREPRWRGASNSVGGPRRGRIADLNSHPYGERAPRPPFPARSTVSARRAARRCR